MHLNILYYFILGRERALTGTGMGATVPAVMQAPVSNNTGLFLQMVLSVTAYSKLCNIQICLDSWTA